MDTARQKFFPLLFRLIMHFICYKSGPSNHSVISLKWTRASKLFRNRAIYAFYNGILRIYTPLMFAIDNLFSCKLRWAFAPDSAICRTDVTHLPIMPDENLILTVYENSS